MTRPLAVVVLSSTLACTGMSAISAQSEPVPARRAIAQYLNLRSALISAQPPVALCPPLDSDTTVQTLLEGRSMPSPVVAPEAQGVCSPAPSKEQGPYLLVTAVEPSTDSTLVKSLGVDRGGAVISHEEYWAKWAAWGGLTIRAATNPTPDATARNRLVDYLLTRHNLTGIVPFVIVCTDSADMPTFERAAAQLLKAGVVAGIHRDPRCALPAGAHHDSTLTVLRIRADSAGLAGKGVTAMRFLGGRRSFNEWPERFTRTADRQAILAVEGVILCPTHSVATARNDSVADSTRFGAICWRGTHEN